MGTQYKEALLKIIDFLKKEKKSEHVPSYVTPTELLDKISGIVSDLPDIKDKIFDDSGY